MAGKARVTAATIREKSARQHSVAKAFLDKVAILGMKPSSRMVAN